MSDHAKLSRRQFLRRAGLGSTALLIAACGQPTPAPAPAVKAEPTKAPVAVAPTAAKPAAPTKPAEPTKAPATAAVAPTPAPAAKDAPKFTYWWGGWASTLLKGPGEIGCYGAIEKATGVKIDFQTSNAPEAFNLMLASGAYPDLIEANWLSLPGGPAKYLKDKVILRLNDLLGKSAPNLNKLLADHPDWRKEIISDEGDVAGFPFLRGDPTLMVFYGPVIRADWLEKLKIPVPTTIDEWQMMLKAFKEKDPNGNGKADELAFSPNWGGTKTYAFDYGHVMVGSWGVTKGFLQDKGTVKFGPLESQFKEFLKTMAAWYKDGLIDPEYAASDAKQMDAKITGDLLGALGGFTGGGIGKYNPLMQGKHPTFKLIGAPYPVLKKGDKPEIGQRDRVYPGQNTLAISTTCKRPQEAAQWCDFAFGPAGHMAFNFGVEGVSYKMDNGYPRYTEEIMKNPQGLTRSDAMSKYMRSQSGGPFVQDKRYFEQYLPLKEQTEAVEIWKAPTNEKLIPPLQPLSEESKKYASIMNDVNTRLDEAFNRILTGADPVDSWDKVVAQLKQMGIEDALKIQQSALERYNKRQ